jgi:hypothetical protein
MKPEVKHEIRKYVDKYVEDSAPKDEAIYDLLSLFVKIKQKI